MTLKKANRVLGKCFIGALLKPFLITGLVVMPAAGLLAQPPLGAPAMNACKGQQQGVRCSFESPHGKVYGSCHALPYKGQGICVPEDRNAAGRGDPSGLQQMKPGRFPGSREHRVLQSDGSPDLLKSSVKPPVKGYFDVSIEDDFRVLKANGIPSHETGRFPNTGNPNAIKP
ncbi:MAG: hypothetical protein KDI30_00770, partial [Pseudomonadales bacterium]|nr:hypothetical protein [Pseudomonadales bacterium]